MGIEMDNSDRAVDFMQGAEYRQDDRVVTSETGTLLADQALKVVPKQFGKRTK